MSGFSSSSSTSKDLQEDSEEIWKMRCMNCIRCNEKTDCRSCIPCKTKRTLAQQTDDNLRAIKAKTAARQAEMASTSSAAMYSADAPPPPPPQEPVEKKKRGRKKKEVVEREKELKRINEQDYVPSRPTRQQSADVRKTRRQNKLEQEEEARQCLQPDCIYEARPGSKYCTPECGRILANMRLTGILPHRVQEYYEDGPAGPRTLDKEIEDKMAEVKREFDLCNKQEQVLSTFLDKLKEFVERQIELKPLGTEEKFDDTLYEGCIVCGQPDIMMRKYTKHIELCWSRAEKSMSFGAPEINHVKIYCEVQEPRTGAYCKRLKSLCPEHRKPMYEAGLKVCGYPKKWSEGTGDYTNTLSELIALEDPFGELGCRTKKDVCSAHLKWVPSLRGTIELEQACLIQKIFELCAEASRLQDKSDWSCNALSILINRRNAAKFIDKEAFVRFVRKMQESTKGSEQDDTSIYSSESSSKEKTDEDMDTAEFLATLAGKRKEEEGGEEAMDIEDEEDEEEDEKMDLGNTTPIPSQDVSMENPSSPQSIIASSPASSRRSSNFSVDRLLE
uniref:CXXC-type zinc finger protein 1 n=2 Tax=Caenorhabditis tropicalis TaxID=1561998 RepID=A0A1I7U2R0_9PELO